MNINSSGLLAVAMAVALLAGCGETGNQSTEAKNKATANSGIETKPLSCDDSLKAAFKPDEFTTVIAVKAFKNGDPLILSGTPTDQTPRADGDLCVVKLNVGPGNPGPEDAPSSSPGIGIEVWLPSAEKWIGRVHALGGNGWAGGNAGSPTLLANPNAVSNQTASSIAATEGAVTSTADSGHSGMSRQFANVPTSNGAFGMDPDGTLSKRQWEDFSSRSLHQQAVKTKALAEAYYGKAPTFSYFDGTSQGGRQGLKLAQEFPDDYDGILARAPAIYWPLVGMGWPGIVTHRDLGGVPLTEGQQDLVSMAAINSCDVVGGEHLGYLMDPSACRYDPTRDTSVLCPNDGGTSDSEHCVSQVQAAAINKLWYGPTADGTVPSPDNDNGWDTGLEGKRRWFGLPRGSSLYNASIKVVFPMFDKLMPSPPPGQIVPFGSDWLALVLQNPALAGPHFQNASGSGENLAGTLSYRQFNNAFDRAWALQPLLDYVNTDNPDLSAFKARGGKMVTVHGIDDTAIPVQGSIHYYQQVIEQLGGLDNVKDFYKLYLLPGVGHQSINGSANPAANPPLQSAEEAYRLVVDWVEKGVEPSDRIEIQSPSGTVNPVSQPICTWPLKATYKDGNPRVAESYACE